MIHNLVDFLTDCLDRWNYYWHFFIALILLRIKNYLIAPFYIWLIVQEIMKKYEFSELKLSSLFWLFYPFNCPNPKMFMYSHQWQRKAGNTYQYILCAENHIHLTWVKQYRNWKDNNVFLKLITESAHLNPTHCLWHWYLLTKYSRYSRYLWHYLSWFPLSQPHLVFQVVESYLCYLKSLSSV